MIYVIFDEDGYVLKNKYFKSFEDAVIFADSYVESTYHDFQGNALELLKIETLQLSSDLIYRLEKRAEIRRQIKSRKSVQEGKADRIADLLEEAAQTLRLAG